MKISVIMPSFLGEFSGAASNRKQLFTRAVISFLSQSFKDSELIIISDGCGETNNIVKKNFKKECLEERIILVERPEHLGFKGIIRQSGIEKARGEIICNLDTDDFFLPYHLKSIACAFNTEKYDWIYWNYYIRPDTIKDMNVLVDVPLELEKLNNACHAFKKGIVAWEGCDGRRDNKIFIEKLMKFTRVKKIYGCGYCMTNVTINKI